MYYNYKIVKCERWKNQAIHLNFLNFHLEEFAADAINVNELNMKSFIHPNGIHWKKRKTPFASQKHSI